MPGTRPLPPSSKKPRECVGCSLYERGHGFVPPDGNPHAPILIMSEAPGYDEAAIGRPMVGAAGGMLDRIFRRNRLQRGQFRIDNILHCTPPALLLEGMPYQHTAIAHCEVHRRKVLQQEHHPVIVAMGATALKTLLNLHGKERIRVEEFHGTVHRSLDDRSWIVPTFHTSFLQRGAHNLIGTVSFDLQVALELSRGEWQPQPMDLVIDPPVDWFRAWVEQLEAAASYDPDSVAIASDIETPDKAGGKPENELGPDDDSYQILRHNFAVHPDQGITIPEDPAYRDLIARVYRVLCRHYWWNGYGYDWARVHTAYPNTMVPLYQLDLMKAAHVLQSDIPLGLGFWAPFYSRYGAWKHLATVDPPAYACTDGPQTLRVGYGVVGDLIAQGQWRAFEEDCHELYHSALKPAQDVGILIDKPALDAFHDDLATKQRRLLHQIQSCVPDALRPLTLETKSAPEPGLLHPEARTTNLRTGELKKDQPDPIKQELYALSAVRVDRQVTRLIQTCLTCGAEDVHKKHRCKDAAGKIDKDLSPQLEMQERLVVRWFWQEPFNPDSPKQMLQYLKFKGHKPGKNKKTKEDSADRDTLVRLWKATRDPFYGHNLDYRAIKKVDSTYAVPTLKRIAKDPEGRLHPIPTFRPSTGRLSYVSPNITNVVADKGGRESLAAGFRRCVVATPTDPDWVPSEWFKHQYLRGAAQPGCRLLEIDYSGIEAIETGWYGRDPRYIRLAKLGVHAYVASFLLYESKQIAAPADLAWSDQDLLAFFKDLKHRFVFIYDRAKRCVHGTNYGLTPFGMAATFPDLYPDLKAAEHVQSIYFQVCPSLPVWHMALRQHAYEAGCLGGPGAVLMTPDNRCYGPKWDGPSPWAHPFQYRHWFWSVLSYKPISESQRLRRVKAIKPCQEINGRWFSVDWGEDSKRVIAFYPQSTAAGVLKRSIRALFCHPDHPSYIGDCYYGRTPLRAPIHDSLLLEVPHRVWDRVVERLARELQRPVVEQPVPAEWNMGTHLSIGVDAKAGSNWLDVEGIKIPSFYDVGLSNEETYFGTEEEDEEDVMELGVVA